MFPAATPFLGILFTSIWGGNATSTLCKVPRGTEMPLQTEALTWTRPLCVSGFPVKL